MSNNFVRQIAKKAAQGKEALKAEIRDFSLQRPNAKVAALGGEQETAFEQSFASLAYAYIQDKAPGLLDYMVGFQLVDRNEDNTKAVGIFGFKVGDQWIYSPVFFLSGDLKGHELLYLKNQDAFVPMKENWVNYVLSRRPHVLGEPEAGNQETLGIMQPNLQALSTPPNGGGAKFASFVPPRLADWAKEIMPKLASWATKHPHKLEKFAGLDERLSLESFLRSDVSLPAMTMDIWEQYPAIKKATCELHGNSLLRDALMDLKERVQSSSYKFASAAPSSGSILAEKVAADKPKVEMLTLSDQDDYTDMTDADKKKILNDGYLIKDYRNGEELSVTYANKSEPVSVTNPSETGIYDLLVKPGDYERCLIIHNYHNGRNKTNDVVAVRIGSGKKGYHTAAPSALFVSEEQKEDAQTYADYFKGLSSNTSLKKGATYVAVTPNGEGTCPFEVEEVLENGSYRVWYRRYTQTSRPRYMGNVEEPDDWHLSNNDDIVHFNNRKGSRLKAMTGGLYLPEGAKVIKVKEAPKPRNYNEECCGIVAGPSEDNYKFPQPGNLADVEMNILQKTSELKLWTDQHEVIVNQSRMSKLSALFHLVRDHSFSEKRAKELLKEAERFGGCRYRVKYAYAPAPPPAMYGADPMAPGVPTIEPQITEQAIPGLDPANTDPAVYDPLNVADPMAMQVAQQAQQSGQKEIFDTAMIGSMLKAVRQDSIVDRYLGDLMKALDRLGRIIFMFYWHNEEFADRYGKQDMPELEDTIRNAFEVVGDLVLFLKQKTIEPSTGGVELGEPDIQDSARI